jgi:hypothetical protein
MNEKQKLSKEKMKEMFGGMTPDDYQKPQISELTEADFNEPATESAKVACRSLLGT